MHVPLGELPERLDRGRPTGRCWWSARSAAARARRSAWLAQQGYDVVNLDGGMLEWEAAGRPMVSETGAPPQVV